MLPIGCARTDRPPFPPKRRNFEAVKAMEAARAASKRRQEPGQISHPHIITGRMSLLREGRCKLRGPVTW